MSERDEPRSFEPARPQDAGEGGGSMSGRGQASPEGPREGHGDGADGSDAEVGAGAADGIASPLQPGGTVPGGGPGASQGSLGTGGGQTGGRDSGAVKRGGV
jgi:hypothetical protein